METFYSTHVIEQVRNALVPLFTKLSIIDGAFTLALTNQLEKSVKFRLPDAGDLLGIDRRKRTFSQDEFDILHMPYPVTALEYTFAPEKHTLTREHSHLSSKRITLVFDIPAGAGAGEGTPFQHLVRAVPRFTQEGGLVIMGFWSNTEDGHPPAPGVLRCDWEVSGGAVLIPRLQEAANLDQAPDNIYTGQFGDLCLYYSITIPTIYESFVRQMGKESVIRSMGADLEDDLNVAYDFMLALSCNNVTVAPAEAESRAKLNKKRVAAKKVPFFDYKQLMIAGAKLEFASVPGASQHSQKDGIGRASPRMHLRRGHVRRLSPTIRTWVNHAVVGAAVRGQISKDYVVTPVAGQHNDP